MRELIMGNEAMGLAALDAGVSVCAGYPGTPSSEILETVAKERSDEVWSNGRSMRKPLWNSPLAQPSLGQEPLLR